MYQMRNKLFHKDRDINNLVNMTAMFTAAISLIECFRLSVHHGLDRMKILKAQFEVHQEFN